MSRQGAGTSVPAPLAYPGGRVAPLVFRAPEGPAAVLPVLWAWPLSVPVGGGPPARSPHASCARSGRSRGPPWPCRHPPAPWPCPPVPPASSTPVGPGHCSAALRVVSKPGRVPPPPTGTAADPSGALHTGGAWCADVWLGASSRSPARPCRRPRAPQPGPPVPSNPSNRSALGRESPKTQTTSVKIGEFGVFWARWSAFWAHSGYE